jgi:hypothetical protein
MAQSDVNNIWTGGNTGSAQAITSSAVRSTGILDLAFGAMLTSASTYVQFTGGGGYLITPSSYVFAEDLGPGAIRLRLMGIIGTAFTGGTSLNVAWQGAVDNSGGAYPANVSSLTWTTYGETGAIPVAQLGTTPSTAKIPNQVFFNLPDWPDRMIATAMPRFISLLYTPVGTFSTGTIAFAGLMTQKPDFNIGSYVGGFQVAP